MTVDPGRSIARRWAARLPAGLLLAGAIAFACVTRISPREIGATGGRLLGCGWHLHAPFREVRRVPVTGHLDAVDLERVTPEGARFEVRLSLDYRLEPGRLEAHAATLSDAGIEGLVADLARPAVEAVPLPDLIAASAGRTDAGRADAGDMIARALGDGGVTAEHLRIGGGGRQAASPDAVASGRGVAAVPAPVREPTGIRLLLIGLDGADWKIIDPLLRAGRMPRLARLVATGVRAPMRSYDPMISPLLWTTMATGVGPDLHGVADFQAIEAATGRHVPITSRFRRVKALWNMLDDAGATSAFVGWWASYPAEAVRGFQVSNLVAFETLRAHPQGHVTPPGLVWPGDYLETIAPRLITAAAIRYEDLRPIVRVGRDEFDAARSELLSPPPSGAGGENRRAVQHPVTLAISILAGTRNYAVIAADLAARHPDLASVYFEGIDMIGHRFQHCMAPRLPICDAADFARFQDAVTGFYELQDRYLGDVVDAAGPGTTIMVVSDHGFRSGSARPADIVPYTTEQPVEWHDPEGIFLLSGPGARRGLRLATRPTLFDVAPTVLDLLGLPAGADMPGHVITAALDAGFQTAHPTRLIPSWETVGGPRRAPAAPGDPAARAAEADLLASLRALGYIGGDEGSRAPTPPGDESAAAAPASALPGETTQVFYHRNLATYFLKRQDFARAVEQLRLANERQKLPKTYQMLSEAYLGMGRRDEAIAALRSALDETREGNAEPVLWLVQLRLQGAGGVDAAREEVRRYASRTAVRPGLDQAIDGVLREAGGDARGALEAYRRSFAADPRRILVGQRLYALEPPDQRAPRLLPALRRSVEEDPRQDEAQNLLGALLAESGHEEAAVAAFQKALDLDPDNARYAANLGGALARLGRWAGAAEAYERAQALTATAVNALKLGSVYRRLGQPERALAAFTEARQRGDDTTATFLGIALSESEQGRLPDALQAIDEGLSRHPGDDALLRLRGELARTASDPKSRRTPPQASAAAVVPAG